MPSGVKPVEPGPTSACAAERPSAEVSMSALGSVSTSTERAIPQLLPRSASRLPLATVYVAGLET